MKTTTPSDLNRNLDHFTNIMRQNNIVHASPFTVEQKYNKQAWTLFVSTTWSPHAINSIETLTDEDYWSIFNMAFLDENDPEYL